MDQAPVARFLKSTSGLSVQFTDSSLYVPTSWDWNFGDGSTSTDRNPLHTFSTSGTYNVVLTVENSQGSNTLVKALVVSIYPTLSQSISEMVSVAVPNGVEVSGDTFDQNKSKWQLFLQPLVNLPPLNNPLDVFNEAIWPPLINILVSKLIIYEAILQAAASSSLAFKETVPIQNTNVTQACDYTTTASNTAAIFPNLRIEYLVANGLNYTYTLGYPATLTALVQGLNTLGIGQFTSSDPNDLNQNFKIISYANPNILTHLRVIPNGGSAYNMAFVQTNCQIINLTQPEALEGGAGNPTQGPVKYIETGPSKVEWYDKSVFWKNIMVEGGVLAQLISEICGFAERLRIKLPMCKLVVETPLFTIYRPSTCTLNKWGGLWDWNAILYTLSQMGGLSTLDNPIDVPFVTQTSVSVNHGLNRYPFVNVVDAEGTQPLFGITHIDLNHFTVAFLTPHSGVISYF